MAGSSNLRPPWKPGDVPNPEGRNQYTYRAEAEKHLNEWCKEYGRELIRVICAEAKAKKPWAAKLMLDRILPAVMQHEHALPDAAGVDALMDRLAGIAATRRTNGGADPAEPKRANGGNGGTP